MLSKLLICSNLRISRGQQPKPLFLILLSHSVPASPTCPALTEAYRPVCHLSQVRFGYVGLADGR